MKTLRKNWGVGIFSLISLLAFVRVLGQEVPGHYRIFTGAARAIWAMKNPYGTDFGTHVGLWFYSPSCAMFFFSLFAWLPEKLGITFYLALSWASFVLGVALFAQVIFKTRFSLTPRPLMNWFWIGISPQIIGAILATKIELIMVGLIFIGCAWLLERKHGLWSAVLLSMIVNWKMQPLPSVALLCLSWLWIERDIVWPLTVAGCLAAWYFLPALFVPGAFLNHIQATWKFTLTDFMAQAWLNFENIYAFMSHAFGIRLSYAAAQIASILIGGLIAAFVSVWALRKIGEDDRKIRALLTGAVLLSIGLGAMFAGVFSPLGQNNGLILYAPLLFSGFISRESAKGRWKTYWSFALAAVILWMTLPYSDLIPGTFRMEFRSWTVKPLGLLLFSLVLAWHSFERDWAIT